MSSCWDVVFTSRGRCQKPSCHLFFFSFTLQHFVASPPWRQHGGRHASVFLSWWAGSQRWEAQTVTAQTDDVLLKRRVCALETNFGSGCSWEALSRINGHIRTLFVSADELWGSTERAGRRLLSPDVTSWVSSSSAPVQTIRLLFWWEWRGFYFALLCHFSYKHKCLFYGKLCIKLNKNPNVFTRWDLAWISH